MVPIVVQMLIRNEVDVITETLAEITRWGLRDIVILDGESDDGTVEAIRAFEYGHGIRLTMRSSPDPDGKFADHRRQELMEMTWQHIASNKINGPVWIISLDADEIYHTSPVEAIESAEAEHANAVLCDIPQFWITLADIRNGLALEDENLSVQERRRWYSWGHTGVFIWLADPRHYYPQDVQKRTPEIQGLHYKEWRVLGSVRPVCKHYCFRSLRQAVKRADERMARGGIKYFGKYALDWLIDEQAAGLHCFDGQHWDTTHNHSRVCDYMGRLGWNWVV